MAGLVLPASACGCRGCTCPPGPGSPRCCPQPPRLRLFPLLSSVPCLLLSPLLSQSPLSGAQPPASCSWPGPRPHPSLTSRCCPCNVASGQELPRSLGSPRPPARFNLLASSHTHTPPSVCLGSSVGKRCWDITMETASTELPLSAWQWAVLALCVCQPTRV